MHTGIVTTPFGRRPTTLALVRGQLKTNHGKLAETADKWKVFRDICEARELLGVNDRALSVLNALLSFHPGQQLDGEKGLVVFPSNEQLTLRAHGITGTTLRRHLAALVECGLITRKDSPNGKRYAHRDRSGKIEDAFGFSLAPILARAAEFTQLAEQILAERKALRLARERLSICRRDIRKLTAAAIEECLPGDWVSFGERLTTILSHLPRASTIVHVTAAADECEILRQLIVNHLETQLNPSISVSSDVQNERHLQNTNTYTNIESERQANNTNDGKPTPVKQRLDKPERTLPLELVLKACPQIHDYAPAGMVSSWRDLTSAATVVRLMLGVSEGAYESSRNTMGPQNTAIAMACILERGGLINSAGGYLRDLTRRAAEGGFSLEPMLMALLRSRPPVPLSNVA